MDVGAESVLLAVAGTGPDVAPVSVEDETVLDDGRTPSPGPGAVVVPAAGSGGTETTSGVGLAGVVVDVGASVPGEDSEAAPGALAVEAAFPVTPGSRVVNPPMGPVKVG